MPSTAAAATYAACEPGRDRPEAQRIGAGHNLRAHAQHVAQNAADARRRAFERHDLRGMVVALVRDDDAILDAVDGARAQNAGIFADADEHVGAARGQPLQQRTAALVRAMLAPLDRKRVRLGARRIAANAPRDVAEFRGRKRKRLAAGEALQLVVSCAADGELFGRVRNAFRHAPALPLPGGALSRASESMTLRRLRYCVTSTLPYSTVSSTPRILAAAKRGVLGLEHHDARHARGQLQAREDFHARPIRADDRTRDHRVRRRRVDERRQRVAAPRDRDIDDVAHGAVRLLHAAAARTAASCARTPRVWCSECRIRKALCRCARHAPHPRTSP